MTDGTTPARTAFRGPFRFVFFDVDSTLVTLEGIDELARGNPEIARLTQSAMNGEIALDEVYARRLEIIRPSQKEVEALGELYCRSLVPAAEDTLHALREKGAHLSLVTAGIAQAIHPLADLLGIRRSNLHAVALSFDGDGNYLDFDRRSMLTRNGGKELVVRSILSRSKGKSAFVGDGASDLETKGLVDLFIGFGGVVTRPAVRDHADVFVSEPALSAVLPYLLG